MDLLRILSVEFSAIIRKPLLTILGILFECRPVDDKVKFVQRYSLITVMKDLLKHDASVLVQELAEAALSRYQEAGAV